MTDRRFGDNSRWLIQKCWDNDGWLVHAPITPVVHGGAMGFPTFEAACQGFAVLVATAMATQERPGWEQQS